MLIIVEGPDCVGKSTLVTDLRHAVVKRRLADRTTVHHASVPRADVLDEYITPLLGYGPNQRDTVICDRWHWGELVYPTVLGRSYTTMTVPKWWYIENFVAGRGGLVVRLTEDHETLVERYRQRGDDLVRVEDLKAVERGYTFAHKRSIVRTYTRPPIAVTTHVDLAARQSVESILTVAGAVEYNMDKLWSAYGRAGYVGPPEPMRLYVVAPIDGVPPSLVLPKFYPQVLEAVYTSKVDANSVGFIVDCDLSTAHQSSAGAWNQVHRSLGRPPVVYIGQPGYRPDVANGADAFTHVDGPARMLRQGITSEEYKQLITAPVWS